jgi:hypothetical protein
MNLHEPCARRCPGQEFTQATQNIVIFGDLLRGPKEDPEIRTSSSNTVTGEINAGSYETSGSRNHSNVEFREAWPRLRLNRRRGA